MRGPRSARTYYAEPAERYVATNPGLPLHRVIEWPAVRALLPDLEEAGVLDAG